MVIWRQANFLIPLVLLINHNKLTIHNDDRMNIKFCQWGSLGIPRRSYKDRKLGYKGVAMYICICTFARVVIFSMNADSYFEPCHPNKIIGHSVGTDYKLDLKIISCHRKWLPVPICDGVKTKFGVYRLNLSSQ